MTWKRREGREDLTLEREQLLPRHRAMGGGEGRVGEGGDARKLAVPLTGGATHRRAIQRIGHAVIKIVPSMSWYQHTA